MKNALNHFNQFLDVLIILSESIEKWISSLNTSFQSIVISMFLKNILMVLMIGFVFTACGERRITEQHSSPDMQTMGDESQLQERETMDTIPGATADRVVEMQAKDHVYFPMEITAQPGEQFYVNLVNGGNEVHSIHIELPQAPLTFGDPVPVGQSRQLLVKAPKQPGRYQIFCPVEDHRERGMIATLIVEEEAMGE